MQHNHRPNPAAPRFARYRLTSGARQFLAASEIEAFDIIRRHDIDDVTIVRIG